RRQQGQQRFRRRLRQGRRALRPHCRLPDGQRLLAQHARPARSAAGGRTAALTVRSKTPVRVPVFLKLAPDLDEAAMDGIARVISATDLDGLIVSNTTIARDRVAGMQNANESGGLSGKPLFELAT